MGLDLRDNKFSPIEVVLFLVDRVGLGVVGRWGAGGEETLHGNKLHHLSCIWAGCDVTQSNVGHLLAIINTPTGLNRDT